jgi:hypothetical protein
MVLLVDQQRQEAQKMLKYFMLKDFFCDGPKKTIKKESPRESEAGQNLNVSP